MTTLSEMAADWASRISFEEIPAEIVRDTKLRILDIVGVMLAARDSEVVSAVRASASDVHAGSGASAVGFSEEMSVGAAALVNGTAALALEFDDSHLESGIHVGSSVVAAALPAAEKFAVSGRKLIEAVLVGNELTCQLGLVAPGMFHRHGFHPTGIIGTFGAAYAVSKCMSFDRDRIVNAIGISGSMAAASMASWEDGTAAKSLHSGMAAASGVTSASLAARGVTGPAVIFDGRFGFFKAHVQETDYKFRFEAFRERLGKVWEVSNIAPKAYPCGHHIQPFVDAALILQRQHGFSAGDITSITCSVSEVAIPLVCEPAPEKRRPKTSVHARFSVQHSVAEALVAKRLDRRSYTNESLLDPAVNSLADKIGHELDPSLADRARLGGGVSVKLTGGRELRHRIDHMRGMPQNPMPMNDLVQKFESNAEGALSPRAQQSTIEAILDLDRCDDMRTILKPLSWRPLRTGFRV